jgi:pyruvate/2-oxoglutarate dehydrogenase complex dihydrolipoamide dehydrogenase (E3) component
MPTRHFDAVIIGSGQGGTPLATAFARRGRSAALIEEARVGGTCVNVGCTPTKTMVASARVAYQARRASIFGVTARDVSVDIRAVRERKARVVESFRAGSERRLADAGVALVRGTARFVDAHTVRVARADAPDETITADLIVINTGARPASPDVAGLRDVAALDSTSIMELDVLPPHLLVLGGGYVGVEFAQMFRRFGSEVTIVQRGARLLPREDADVADALRDILREEGLTVMLDAAAMRAERSNAGVRLGVRVGGEERAIEGSHVLVASGRAPNTESLDLAAAGVVTDERGHVRVNDRLETSASGVYAIGDVKGGPAFTHISYDDFRILRTNLLDGGSASTAGRFVPYTVFTDPELASVGLTEREARAQGRRFWVARLPMRNVARALEADETRGALKAIVDADSGHILGCSFLGIAAGEMMSLVQVAMMGGLPYTALRDGTFSHPTLAEAMNNLFTRPTS